jgi:hypothetical protein
VGEACGPARVGSGPVQLRFPFLSCLRVSGQERVPSGRPSCERVCACVCVCVHVFEHSGSGLESCPSCLSLDLHVCGWGWGEGGWVGGWFGGGGTLRNSEWSFSFFALAYIIVVNWMVLQADAPPIRDAAVCFHGSMAA